MRLSYALSIAVLALDHLSYATPSRTPNPLRYLLPRDAHAKNWSPPRQAASQDPSDALEPPHRAGSLDPFYALEGPHRAASPDPFEPLVPPLQQPAHPETPPESQDFILPPFRRLAPSWRPTTHGVGSAPPSTPLDAGPNPFRQSTTPAHLPLPPPLDAGPNPFRQSTTPAHLPLPPPLPNGQMSQPIQVPDNPDPAIPRSATSDLSPLPRPRPHYSAPPRRNPTNRPLPSFLPEDSPQPHRQRGRSRERTPRFPRPPRSESHSPPPPNRLQPRKIWDKNDDSPTSPRPHLVRPLPYPPPSNPFVVPLTPPSGPSPRQALARNPASHPLFPLSSPAESVPDPPTQPAPDAPVQLPPDPPVRPGRQRRQLPYRVYADEPAHSSSSAPPSPPSSHSPIHPPPHPSWARPIAPSPFTHDFYAVAPARSSPSQSIRHPRARRPRGRRPQPRPRRLRCAYLERFWRPPVAEWCYANMKCRYSMVVGVKRVRTLERVRARELCKGRCECV